MKKLNKDGTIDKRQFLKGGEIKQFGNGEYFTKFVNNKYNGDIKNGSVRQYRMMWRKLSNSCNDISKLNLKQFNTIKNNLDINDKSKNNFEKMVFGILRENLNVITDNKLLCKILSINEVEFNKIKNM